MLNAAIWPTLDYSRVPYRLYHDPEAYQREQERIFRGPTWNFLGLEAEIPNPGDFRTTYVGDTAMRGLRGGSTSPTTGAHNSPRPDVQGSCPIEGAPRKKPSVGQINARLS